MLFNSIHFLIFFPIVTLLFFTLKGRSRLVLLLIASCVFYAAFIPKFLFILFGLIITDYAAGLLMEPAQGRKRKTYLVMSLVANLGVLATFKYLNFFSANLNSLLQFLHVPLQAPALSLILPIGLSFHTFQSMSYTIEVYKGNQTAERDILIYALYVLFYPQLVAGPIERPGHLLHQFREAKKFDLENLSSGCTLMLWGFFKKMFVADRLAQFVKETFVHGQTVPWNSFSLLLGIYFFTFQIYFDFSGYTDIARGAARVMGFSLIENFQNPYGAKNISEFWHRWHISLSTWFRDYLYIPLGGSRTSLTRWMFNIMVVFLLSGLWHGANWTFAIWGALHGFFIIVSRLRQKFFSSLDDRMPDAFKILITFNLVAFGWIFFRADDLSMARDVVLGLFSANWKLSPFIHLLLENENARTGVLALITFVGLAWYRQRMENVSRPVSTGSLVPWRGAIWFAVVLQLIIIGAPLNETAFIYFQF